MHRRNEKGQTTLIVLVIIFLLVIAVGCASFKSVGRGRAQVVTNKGAVTNRILEPGWHFIVPIVEGVVQYDTTVTSYETSDNPDSSEADFTDYPVSAQTSDGQQIIIKYTIVLTNNLTEN